MGKRLKIALTILVLSGFVAGGYFFLEYRFQSSFDANLRRALKAVQKPHTYEVAVETSTALSGRYIDVLGLYRLDFDADRYASYATTTITNPQEKPPNNRQSFTLQNLSIGDDIFVKIETDSPQLKKTIPQSPQWQHFQSTTIPEQFKGIAIDGPVLDSLSLLSKRGAYLSLEGAPAMREFASSTFRVYMFKLSGKNPSSGGGTLQSLMGHIGTGTVSIWLNESDSVHLIHMQGEGYSSTTTVLSINIPLYLAAPQIEE